MKPISILVILFLASQAYLFGQSSMGGNVTPPSPVMVTKVTFKQGTTLTNDDGSAMDTAHWTDEKSDTDPMDFPDGIPDPDPGKPKPNNVKSYAYSYVSNKRPMVEAVFKWKNGPPPEGSPYWAEGKVVETPNCEFKLEKRELVQENTTYPETVADQNIVKERLIQAYVTANRKVDRSGGPANLVPVTIEWTVYDHTKVKEVGKSRSTHTIYVTWDEPATTLRQETLFNLSCVMANGEAVSEADSGKAVFEKIWSEFTDQKVKRMDGTTMKYWGEYSMANRNTQNADFYNVTSLLINADGVCQTWQEFLNAATRAQAITAAIPVKISIDKSRNYAINGVTKNHSFGKIDPIFMLNHRVYVDFHTTPTIKTTLPGQGNPAPPIDNFVNHTFIRFLGRVYDPSYGTDHNDCKEWENDNLCAFCIVEDTTPNDDNDNAIENWWVPNDSNSEDLKYEDL